jgi:hypothetical protein
LPSAAFRRWLHRRGAVQRYFERWGWPEFRYPHHAEDLGESPYGREQQSRLPGPQQPQPADHGSSGGAAALVD